MRTESHVIPPTSTVAAARLTRAIAATGLLGLALALAGCAPGGPPLAKVGDHEITIDQFESLAQSSASRYPMAVAQAKAALLDDLVRRELMLVAAERLHVIPESLLARQRANREEEVLGGALLQTLSVRGVGVSDAEVRKLYAWRGTASHVQVIVTPDEGSARAALGLVRRGADFGAVAGRFDVNGMLPPGGDLGFVQPGQLVNPLDTYAREAPIGVVQGPFAAGDSWFVLRVVGREPRPEGPYEVEAPNIQAQLEQRKERMFLVHRYDVLRDAYGIAADPQGVEALFATLAGGSLAPGQYPTLAPAQRRIVVGRWDAGPEHRGAYTLGEALADLEAGRGTQLNPRVEPAVEQWIRMRIMQKLTVVEARRRHLDETPAVAMRLREQGNDDLAQVLYQQAVAAHATPSADEIHDLYMRVSPQLAQLHSVQLQTMTLPDSAAAVHAAMQANGRRLSDAVMLASPKLGVHEETVTFPTRDSLWQRLQPAFLSQPPGSFFGPFLVADGWKLVQLVQRDAPVPAFEALPPQVQQQITQQAGQAARERRLVAYTDSLRAAIPVTVNQDALRRARWPRFNFMMMPPG